MTTAIQTAKQPIIMKSGLVHWVTEGTADRVRQALANQTAHSFMDIKELRIAVNTAEIEGVYTMGEYDALTKTKQGMWQCPYMKWHGRTETCECQKEIFKKQKALKKLQEEEAQSRPRTPEEERKNRRVMEETRQFLKDRGIIK